MRYLTNTADEIDEKLLRIPLMSLSSSKWNRTDDWTLIVDQDYNSESAFAQSGTAVSKAVADAAAKLLATVITDEEIESLFVEDTDDDIEPASTFEDDNKNNNELS